MPGFEKIDLDLKNEIVTPLSPMARTKKHNAFIKKHLKVISIGSVIFVIFLLFGLILPPPNRC